ncbi:MAG: beta-propeller fold lactonase family protein [Candidatus Binatia bacterium]
MSSSPIAAFAARLVFVAAVASFAANLTACGADGGLSSDLQPGPPTSAPPGDVVIYAAMAQGNRIDAFRLGADGLMPSEPFDTIFVSNPRRLALADGVLYATLFDRVISMKLGSDGSLPSSATSTTSNRSDYDPVDLEVNGGILYVASAGLGRVQSFELEADGSLPFEPSGSGTGEFPGDYSSLERNGEFLYAGARESQFIDVFFLDEDGNVPAEAEPQVPQDRIALPEDIVIRDNILYVTSASDISIRAYRIQPNGFLAGEEDSRTRNEEFYSDILLDGDTLVAAAYNAGRIDFYTISPNGMLPEERPFLKTQQDPSSYPAHMIMADGILYVAQAGLDRIDAYALDGDGLPPRYPTSSTTPARGDSLPLHLAMYRLD